MSAFTFDLTTLGSAIVFTVFWFARLEFMVKQNKSSIDTLFRKHDEMSVEIRAEIKKISKSIARIEGFMARRGEE